MRKIITIGREFGSGGRELGRRLSEQLQIAYYDREIVTEIAKRIRLRFAPTLILQKDTSAEYSAHIQSILDKIKQEEKPAAASEEAEHE